MSVPLDMLDDILAECHQAYLEALTMSLQIEFILCNLHYKVWKQLKFQQKVPHMEQRTVRDCRVGTYFKLQVTVGTYFNLQVTFLL